MKLNLLICLEIMEMEFSKIKGHIYKEVWNSRRQRWFVSFVHIFEQTSTTCKSLRNAVQKVSLFVLAVHINFTMKLIKKWCVWKDYRHFLNSFTKFTFVVRKAIMIKFGITCQTISTDFWSSLFRTLFHVSRASL